jgi:hypothetical protein
MALYLEIRVISSRMLWRARSTSSRSALGYGTQGVRRVYGNLGLETVWYRCQNILASDAGTSFGFIDKLETDCRGRSLS